MFIEIIIIKIPKMKEGKEKAITKEIAFANNPKKFFLFATQIPIGIPNIKENESAIRPIEIERKKCPQKKCEIGSPVDQEIPIVGENKLLIA